MDNQEAIEVLENSWREEYDYCQFKEACTMAIAALRAQLEAEKNEPLTLEELLQMGGEPVWVEFVEKTVGRPIPPLWMLVNVCEKQLVADFEYIDWTDEGWLAYRYKKEADHETD